MKSSANQRFRQKLASGVRTMAHRLRVDRRDGVRHGWTTHDEPHVFAGLTYKPQGAPQPTNLESGLGLAVDNADVSGVVNDDDISESDILAGKFDRCRVSLEWYDWMEPDDYVILATYTVQEVRVDSNGRFYFGMVGLQERLQKVIGHLILPTCRWTFGGPGCLFPIETVGIDGVIASAGEASLEVDATAGSDFDWGHVKFMSGPLAGQLFEVREHESITLHLWAYLPELPNPGDQVRVYRGCAKTFAACKGWGNKRRFGGYPHTPGPALAGQIPDTSQRGDG